MRRARARKLPSGRTSHAGKNVAGLLGKSAARPRTPCWQRMHDMNDSTARFLMRIRKTPGREKLAKAILVHKGRSLPAGRAEERRGCGDASLAPYSGSIFRLVFSKYSAISRRYFSGSDAHAATPFHEPSLVASTSAGIRPAAAKPTSARVRLWKKARHVDRGYDASAIVACVLYPAPAKDLLRRYGFPQEAILLVQAFPSC